MTVLMHLSDLHFGAHDPVVCAAVQRLAQRLRVAMVVVSGDLTQRATAAQFAAARAFVDELATLDVPLLGCLPGNHDIPLFDLWQRLFKEKGAELEQEYLVDVAGSLDEKGIKRLSFGFSYKGTTLPPCKVSWQSETRLRFAIKAVQPGQLRYMCEHVGLQVLGIRRLRFGRTGLAKLPAGQWRYLGLNEKF